MSLRIDPVATLASTPTFKAAYTAIGNRGPGFDTVRLVAASAVVLHHALKIEYDIVRDDFLFNFSQGYTQLGLFAVSVFFALSGFLVTPRLAKNGDVIEYLSRRFMRIMPLLAFIVILTGFVIGPFFSSLSWREYYSSPQTWWYLKNITTSLSLQLPGVTDYDGGDTINGPMWTLRYEWICYFVIAFCSLLTMLRHRLLFLLLYLGCIGVLLFAFGPISADNPRGALFMILYLFSYFGAGTLMFLFADVLRWNGLLFALAFAFWCAALATGLSYVLVPLLTAYLVVGVGLIRFPWSPFFSKFDLSYGVYLSHSVFLMMLMNLFAFDSWVPLFVCALALSYVFAYLTWTFLEAPALRQKSLPARLAKQVIARIPMIGPRLLRGQ